MGRRATEPEVVDLGTAYWHIGRVRDPDDEFATKEVLTAEGWAKYNDGDSSFADDYDVLSFGRRDVADDALEAYRLGFAEAAACANVTFVR
jgi:hypothetical protein